MKTLLMLAGVVACLLRAAMYGDQITPTRAVVLTVLLLMWCGVVNVVVDMKKGVRG